MLSLVRRDLLMPGIILIHPRRYREGCRYYHGYGGTQLEDQGPGEGAPEPSPEDEPHQARKKRRRKGEEEKRPAFLPG